MAGKSYFDDKFLAEVGLADLPAEEKQVFLKYIQHNLELRIGETLALGLSAETLSEFESYVEANDNQQTLAWLKQNAPHYKDVVIAEIAKLKAHLKKVSPQIIAKIRENKS